MFYKVVTSRTITLHPKYFGRHLEQMLLGKLNSEVAGACLGPDGYCIAIIRLLGREPGKLQEATGLGIFKVKYEAIMMRPFRNEIIDAEVTICSEQGFFAEAGPIGIFVHSLQMPEEYRDNFSVDKASWKSNEEDTEIRQSSGVRLRILNIQMKEGKYNCIATMKGKYLGQLFE